MDAKHDQVDGPPDEGLSTTTTRKAGMDQKGNISIIKLTTPNRTNPCRIRL
jgi:hypothetical protein